MPIHDWTKVPGGLFQDQHNAWMTEIRNSLNGGVLPTDYYAVAEQVIGPFGPDILTLQTRGDNSHNATSSGSLALAVVQPQVRVATEIELEAPNPKQRSLVIRHASDDRIIALIEIVSPGNKASRHALFSFTARLTAALSWGIHLLILDLQPPTPRDPHGIHGVILDELGRAPPDKPLTLAAYAAGQPARAFIEPTAVGDSLIDMPLFLEPGAYVNVPLEATYLAAYRGVPQRWKRVLEG